MNRVSGNIQNFEKVIGNYIYNFNDYLGQGSYSQVYLGKVSKLLKRIKERNLRLPLKLLINKD